MTIEKESLLGEPTEEGYFSVAAKDVYRKPEWDGVSSLSREKTRPPRNERRERDEAIVRSTVEFLRSHYTTEEEYQLVVKAVLDDSPEVIDRILQERRLK